MNGNAPKSPATGAHACRVKNFHPNAARLRCDRKTKIVTMNRTITKMLHAHNNIIAAKLVSANRPLPREFRKARIGEISTGITAAFAGSSTGETCASGGLTDGDTPCSCLMLIRLKLITRDEEQRTHCIRQNSSSTGVKQISRKCPETTPEHMRQTPSI